ncbi:glycosyl hydrolase family 95 catalytic domain-containing protein [Sphingobacterium sp. UME9]|uniref:glycosyl hydrolase family 95 catalytic domain-containing protein n=1 Tax=Sphingobacterium sp. UME9 TaxID=1862316 RepID=UPI001603D4F3|nr:glycoside hydrolase N-terminal domain-containing protein [Sphingobacterium sp. UME9]
MKSPNLKLVFFTCFLGFCSFGQSLAQRSPIPSGMLDRSKAIVSQYVAKFDRLATQIPSQVAVDAPLLGNGSTGVAIAGTPDRQTYYLARNDFWRLKSGFNESYPAVLGKVEVAIPMLKKASYQVDVDLYTAIATSTFQAGDTLLEIRSFVSEKDDCLILQFQNKGKQQINGQINLLLPAEDQFKNNPPAESLFPAVTQQGTRGNGTIFISRGFEELVDIPTKAAAAGKIITQQQPDFNLHAGESLTYVCALSSNFKSKNCVEKVLKTVDGLDLKNVKLLEREHKKWWADFWSESYVEIPDKVIEKQYYLSHYVMGSCSRDPQFAPPIFGTWITREIPNWNGDYHLNYNYMAPYYGLYSSNHLAAAGSYEQPLLDFMERGKFYSKEITGISEGLLYPVGIGPKGMETTRQNAIMESVFGGYIQGGQVEHKGLFFGQKSNVSYGVTNMATAFYTTYDRNYARKIYPYVRGAAVFWTNYVKKDENGRYVIFNDAIHEGTVGDSNPILSLGLVRQTLQLAADLSAYLDVDRQLAVNWTQVKANLATFPVQEKEGQSVFRYTEKGPAWWNDNTLGIQHIFPAMQIDLESDQRWITIARNTIEKMGRWTDNNGTNSFFPAAVRVGYSADSILYHLHRYSQHTYPNGFQRNNPHGIENCSTVPTTINQMLCGVHQQVLKLFPVWPKQQHGQFGNLRVDGAFLVSSKLDNGVVTYVEILSEQGRNLILDNPWPGHKISWRKNGKIMQPFEGDRLRVATKKGDRIYLQVAVQ